MITWVVPVPKISLVSTRREPALVGVRALGVLIHCRGVMFAECCLKCPNGCTWDSKRVIWILTCAVFVIESTAHEAKRGEVLD